MGDLMNLHFKSQTDTFNRQMYQSCVGRREDWLADLPTAARSVTNYEPAEKYQDGYTDGWGLTRTTVHTADFGGIQVCDFDEDWEAMGLSMRIGRYVLPALPALPALLHPRVILTTSFFYFNTHRILFHGRTIFNFVTSPKKSDGNQDYFGDFEINSGASGSAGGVVDGGRSEEYDEDKAKADSQCFFNSYFSNMMPPSLSTWTYDDMTSDPGIVTVMRV